MTSTHVVYLRDSRGIVNHYFNMFVRKGGMETLPGEQKMLQAAQGNLCDSHFLWGAITAPHPEKDASEYKVTSTVALKLLSRLHSHQFSSEIPLCEKQIVPSKFP